SLMAANQLTRTRCNQWQNFFCNKLPAPLIQLFARMTCKWLKLKVQEFVNIKRAIFILFIKFNIFCCIYFLIKHFLFNEKLRPLKIAVSCEKRIIQIK